ncbi:MAG: hypothetical protein HY566_00920 [Candidatus Kerfeldbacteria bacterium]|nr:hypothetical protein [Candidatus Kerfeldbacteria bacterium]
MDTDTLVERFIEQAKNWDALPDVVSMPGQDYQMVHPNLDLRDEVRVRIKLRSIINGFGDTIIITKADGALRGHITVWAPQEPKLPGSPAALFSRAR